MACASAGSSTRGNPTSDVQLAMRLNLVTINHSNGGACHAIPCLMDAQLTTQVQEIRHAVSSVLKERSCKSVRRLQALIPHVQCL